VIETAFDEPLRQSALDMASPVSEQRLFFATARRQGAGLDAIDELGLRPAAFARYRDLARLRYDFPLILITDGMWTGSIRSLSSIIDEMLSEVAPRGLEGERLRKHVLRLEREIRTRSSAGERGRLSTFWAAAAKKLASSGDPAAGEVLAHIAEKLGVDGEVVDCDAAMAARVCEHLWQTAQQRKARSFRSTVERLVVRLSDILRAAFLHSEAGQRPDALRASLGGTHRQAFDFDVFSRLVSRNVPKDELSPARRARIEHTLLILKAQRFFADPRLPEPAGSTIFEFRFDDCAAAAEAFHHRLPALAEVVRAVAIGELEATGRYVEAKHDAFFEHFASGALSAEDLALFPDYLVCIPPGRNDAPENARLVDILSAGLPVKVLVESSDLVEEAAVGSGHYAFGVRSTRLANTATALGGVFVVQGPGSHLYALRERVERAFAHRGPALLSVYAGAGASSIVSPYLTTAAAMESRAFPAFTYDPYAGDNQAARFFLENNPQSEADWPVSSLEYADENQQRMTEEAAFTIADFALCDRRYAGHFARVPRERWSGALVPVDEWLAADEAKQAETLPCLLAVDAEDVFQRVIVDARLMQIAARVRTFWHRLQEQGGIHNSHAEILVAREKAKWDEAQARDSERHQAAAFSPEASVSAAGPVLSIGAPSESAASPLPPAAPARDPDEAWIETARCPSCNECQTINDRMFKYNDNKQAYLADISAGTYRELVEAAEACQVAIIHPGKPLNADEPGIAELLERAKPFL
jgi:ferredoxin